MVLEPGTVAHTRHSVPDLYARHTKVPVLTNRNDLMLQ